MPVLDRPRTSPLSTLREEMDRLFERFCPGDFGPMRWEPFGIPTFPAVNTWEDEANVYVEAELPGVSSESLEVSVCDNELTIKGDRPQPQIPEPASWQRREVRFGPFSRVVRLPVAVDENQVEASLANGVLTITLGKATTAKTRKIKIHTVSG